MEIEMQRISPLGTLDPRRTVIGYEEFDVALRSGKSLLFPFTPDAQNTNSFFAAGFQLSGLLQTERTPLLYKPHLLIRANFPQEVKYLTVRVYPGNTGNHSLDQIAEQLEISSKAGDFALYRSDPKNPLPRKVGEAYCAHFDAAYNEKLANQIAERGVLALHDRLVILAGCRKREMWSSSVSQILREQYPDIMKELVLFDVVEMQGAFPSLTLREAQRILEKHPDKFLDDVASE